MVRTTTAKGTRVTGADRNRLAADLKRRYESGESIRALAKATGRSYGFIHRILTESGVELRGRGSEHQTERGIAEQPDQIARQVVHIVPDLPGQAVPPGAVAVPADVYDRARRRAIAQLIREQDRRIQQGDFSDFTEVTAEEFAACRLDA